MNNNKNFEAIIGRIKSISDRLQEMINDDIPEAFPVIESPSGTDDSFNHASSDFPNLYDFLTVIPDSIAPLEVIRELESYIMTAKVLVEDLYPREMVNDNATVRIKSDFQSVQRDLNAATEILQSITTILTQMQSRGISMTVDLKALRNLKNRIIRIGFDYVHNDFTLPVEFQSIESIVYNKANLKRVDAALPPQIEQFRNKQINVTKPNVVQFRNDSLSDLLKKYRW